MDNITAFQVTVKSLRKKAADLRAEADKCDRMATAIFEMVGADTPEVDEAGITNKPLMPSVSEVARFVYRWEQQGNNGISAGEIYSGMTAEGHDFRYDNTKVICQRIRALVSRYRPSFFQEATDGKIRLSAKQKDEFDTSD